MKQAEYHSWVREHQFFDYPTLGLAIGVAITLLLPPLAARFGMSHNASTFIVTRVSLGGACTIFSILFLLLSWA